MTPSRPLTSSPATASLRGRNRLEVFLARRTRAPGGMLAYEAPSRSTASLWDCQPFTCFRLNLCEVTQRGGIALEAHAHHHGDRDVAEIGLVTERLARVDVA